jgi:hypothetical protein
MTMTIGSTNCPETSTTSEWVEYDCTGTIGTTLKVQADSGKPVNFCGIEAEGNRKSEITNPFLPSNLTDPRMTLEVKANNASSIKTFKIKVTT